MHGHAVVWLDSREARIFRFNATDAELERIKANSPFRKVHHKAGAIGSGHAHLNRDYFDRIVDAMRGVEEWLLVGPGSAKNELLAHIETHLPWLKAKMAGLEVMDHPTDGALVDHARRFFKAADRMRPNSPSAASRLPTA